MVRRFVNDVGGKYKITLKEGNKPVATLLWGDSVEVLGTTGSQVRVAARNFEGVLPASALGEEGLLELYVIDVGQGDGVLMRTPDDRWHLIDAGVTNEAQMTKRGAANFLRWKFLDDLRRPGVELANVIITHSDFDHYGGVIDVLRGKVQRPERTFPVSVESLWHCGIGRFAGTHPLGAITDGGVEPPPFPDFGTKTEDSFLTELLTDKSSFRNPTRPFEAGFAELARLVGSVPTKVARLSHRDRFLPGYDGQDGGVTIRVLGPVLEQVAGVGPGLRVFDDDSKTRNGHSIVLRIEHGNARILLTGDLNTASQRLLLSYHPAAEFAVDVAKGCHHGSDDIDLRFVQAMAARATVISSGDNESYAHPRPRVMGASARYGRESKHVKGERLPPLLYSTELARSVTLAHPRDVRERKPGAAELAAANMDIRAEGKGAKFQPLAHTPLATDLIYGLINVRTDGRRILCAYMEEQGGDFDLQVFRAGVAP